MRSAVGKGAAPDCWSRWSLIPGLEFPTAYAGTSGVLPAVPERVPGVGPENPSAAYAIYRSAREHRFRGAEYRAILVEGR